MHSVTNYKVGGESLWDATPATLTLSTNRRESFQHGIELGWIRLITGAGTGTGCCSFLRHFHEQFCSCHTSTVCCQLQPFHRLHYICTYAHTSPKLAAHCALSSRTLF